MKTFVWINSIVFVLYGIGFTLCPENLSQLITDNIPSSTSGLIDMRATYGGMSIGFGMFLGYLTRTNHSNRIGVVAIILMMSGMALGRIIGIFQDSSANKIMYIYLFLEVIAVMIGLGLLSRDKRFENEYA